MSPPDGYKLPTRDFLSDSASDGDDTDEFSLATSTSSSSSMAPYSITAHRWSVEEVEWDADSVPTFYEFGFPVAPLYGLEAKAQRKKMKEMAVIYAHFEQVATEVAKWLVHEKYSKVKFVRPQESLGGIGTLSFPYPIIDLSNPLAAGGDKFIVKSILFKFVTDRDMGRSTSSGHSNWLYGGDRRNDAIAYKAARYNNYCCCISYTSNELKGALACYYALRHLRLPIQLPLISIIDYCGYRIIAGILHFFWKLNFSLSPPDWWP